MANTGKKNLVGLDIGSHSLKLVQLELSGRRLKLVKFSVRRLPPDIVKGGEIVNRERLKRAVRDLLFEQKLREVFAAMAVPGVVAEVALAELPPMSEEELEECMDWECRQRFGFGGDQAAMDYQVVGGGDEAGDERIDLLLAGANRDTVAEYLEAVRGTGITLSEINVCSLALADAYEYCYGPGGSHVVLVHAGAEVTEVVVLEGGLPVFVRCIRKGGNGITRSLEATLSVDFERAEAVKTGKDISGDEAREVDRIVENGAEELVSEVKRALDDYASFPGAGSEFKIILSGGCSKLPAVSRQVKKQLSVKLEFFNPFKGITYKKFNPKYITHYTPEAAVALGLSLRGAVA